MANTNETRTAEIPNHIMRFAYARRAPSCSKYLVYPVFSGNVLACFVFMNRPLFLFLAPTAPPAKPPPRHRWLQPPPHRPAARERAPMPRLHLQVLRCFPQGAEQV